MQVVGCLGSLHIGWTRQSEQSRCTTHAVPLSVVDFCFPLSEHRWCPVAPKSGPAVFLCAGLPRHRQVRPMKVDVRLRLTIRIEGLAHFWDLIERIVIWARHL